MAFEGEKLELFCSVVVGAGVNYLLQMKLPNSEIATTVSIKSFVLRVIYLTSLIFGNSE